MTREEMITILETRIEEVNESTSAYNANILEPLPRLLVY